MKSRSGPSGVVTAVVLAVGAVACTAGLFLGLHDAPVDRELLMSQKIFYFHVPIGMGALVLTLVGAGAGIVYLITRRRAADLLCEACYELVIVAATVALVTGSLWAKPAWDAWFPWNEPRVLTILVLLLIALVHAAVRSSIDEPGRRARISAVVAIFGAADAVLAYYAVRIWNSLHPVVITVEGGIQTHPAMKRAFLLSLLGVALALTALVQARWRTARLRCDVEELEDRLADIEPARGVA